ncbi:MAG TPA: YtxH domain-containing protein [Flavobacterium sp.]|jgi:gas vesicle protein
MNSRKVMLGTVVGLLAGAAIGILLAPDKGSATRRNITTKGGDFLGNFKNRYNSIIDTLTSKLDEAANAGNHPTSDTETTSSLTDRQL